jgi:hypothetical protein
MSPRSRIRVPAKKPRSWGVTLVQSRGKFLGYVGAPDQNAAELEAARLFSAPSEWQRKRLLVRERLERMARLPHCWLHRGVLAHLDRPIANGVSPDSLIGVASSEA